MARNDRIYVCYEIISPGGTVDLQKEHIGPWWDWYRGYLESEVWKEVRQRVFRAAKMLCQRCQGEAETVHHLTYVRVGYERWGDLEALCLVCHDEEHMK